MRRIKQAVMDHAAHNGMTLHDVADELSMVRSTLYAKMRGASELRLDEARTLAQMLGVSLEELYQMSIEEV